MVGFGYLVLGIGVNFGNCGGRVGMCGSCVGIGLAAGLVGWFLGSVCVFLGLGFWSGGNVGFNGLGFAGFWFGVSVGSWLTRLGRFL